MKQVLVAVGNHSEMVRLAPVIRALRDDHARAVSTRWIHTGLGPDRVWQTGALFGLVPNREFELRASPDNLVEHSWELTNAISRELDQARPDLLMVQGDSLSSMLASQQAFMRRIPVVYLPNANRAEGLRDPRRDSYRRLLSAVSSFQCLASERDVGRLREEGVPSFEMGVTGDTMVDALELVMRHGVLRADDSAEDQAGSLDNARILVAPQGHALRAGLMTDLSMAIAELAEQHAGLSFTLTIDPDAPVRGMAYSILESIPNVMILDAPCFHEFLCLLQRHDLVMTDSDDVLAQAITLDKPALALADAGLQDSDAPSEVHCIGPDQDSVASGIRAALYDSFPRRSRSGEPNPLGDGQAAKRIGQLIANWSRNEALTPRAFEPFRRLASPRGISANLHAA